MRTNNGLGSALSAISMIAVLNVGCGSEVSAPAEKAAQPLKIAAGADARQLGAESYEYIPGEPPTVRVIGASGVEMARIVPVTNGLDAVFEKRLQVSLAVEATEMMLVTNDNRMAQLQLTANGARPIDDASAQVMLDLSGRLSLVGVTLNDPALTAVLQRSLAPIQGALSELQPCPWWVFLGGCITCPETLVTCLVCLGCIIAA